MTNNVMDPRELVKDLADRIGLDNLMAAASDLQNNAPVPDELDRLRRMNEALEKQIEFLERKNALLDGKIDALKFALRCNGISGADVR